MRIKHRVLLAGALLLATFGLASSASANTTCIPYNSQYMLCSTMTYNNYTQQWEFTVDYRPYAMVVDIIE